MDRFIIICTNAFKYLKNWIEGQILRFVLLILWG